MVERLQLQVRIPNQINKLYSLLRAAISVLLCFHNISKPVNSQKPCVRVDGWCIHTSLNNKVNFSNLKETVASSTLHSGIYISTGNLVMLLLIDDILHDRAFIFFRFCNLGSTVGCCRRNLAPPFFVSCE